MKPRITVQTIPIKCDSMLLVAETSRPNENIQRLIKPTPRPQYTKLFKGQIVISVLKKCITKKAIENVIGMTQKLIKLVPMYK